MGVVVAPDGKNVYVTTGRGRKVFVIDSLSCQILTSFEVGERPWGIVLTPDRNKLYTANGPSDDVSVVDVASQKVVTRIKVGTRPWGVAVVRPSQ
jgi:YVTN family beta-propeller protein